MSNILSDSAINYLWGEKSTTWLFNPLWIHLNNTIIINRTYRLHGWTTRVSQHRQHYLNMTRAYHVIQTCGSRDTNLKITWYKLADHVIPPCGSRDTILRIAWYKLYPVVDRVERYDRLGSVGDRLDRLRRLVDLSSTRSTWQICGRLDRLSPTCRTWVTCFVRFIFCK